MASKPTQKDLQNLLIGSHMSVAGGLHRAFERGRSIGCRAIQIFTKNARGWHSAPLEEEQIRLFRKELDDGMSDRTAAHASYLINLGAPPGPVADRSMTAIVDEIERCEALAIPFLVLHPGAHVGGGEEPGMDRIAARLDEAHRRCSGFKTRVLLENAAGQGSCLGHRFEHLEGILSRVADPERLRVCFDTCHAFAGGYDIRTAAGYETTMQEFDQRIGLDRIALIHLNDSKKGLDCRVDRHEHIGRGEIGLEAFRCLVNDSRLAGIPKILETPKGPDMAEDVENMTLLEGLLGKKKVPFRRAAEALDRPAATRPGRGRKVRTG